MWNRICGAVAAATILGALTGQAPAGVFDTPVAKEDLDAKAYADWVDGKEQPRTESPEWVLWTKKTAPGHNGAKFGESKSAGLRHLRIGFNRPVPVGSVLVRATEGVQLSVLKPGAKYPGALASEADWTPAQRVGKGDVAIWVLPPQIETRALKFSYTVTPTQGDLSGWLGGAFVLAGRFSNVAPEAMAIASANPAAAKRINDGLAGPWDAWDNGKEGANAAVSPEHPEWVMLVWPREVRLQGLCALVAGFSEAQVQVYAGPADSHPREAATADWRTLRTAPVSNQYPRTLPVNWLEFDQAVTARAVRVRITRPIDEAKAHPHLKGNSKEGKRIWLGELMALDPLGERPLETAAPRAAETVHPPIPVRFTLKEPGYVTLVIEDADGTRVRNLVGETYFPAGENVAWWDALDDLGRDNEAAAHGVYHIPGAMVKPGSYRVRGLTRRRIDLRYETTVYNPGTPPWPTQDRTGGWLADHSPPGAALFVPGVQPRVLIASYVAEGGDGVAVVDMAGRKIGGFHWLGGNWTGASHLARDAGEKAVPGIYAYTGAGWSGDENKQQGEVRLTALTDGGDRPVLRHPVGVKPKDATGSAQAELAGLAVHNGLLVAALADTGELLFVEVSAPQAGAKPDAKGKPLPIGKALGAAPLAGVRGLAFDRQGRLIAVVGREVHRYTLGVSPMALPKPQVLVANGLEAPQQLALDEQCNLYVSDRGASHQVKVFTSEGKPLRTIGVAGPPKAGPYDPNHMNNPNGLTVASDGRLWVAETDYQPKRVSVWTPDGKLAAAFYGPPQYGGGGELDPKDKTRFYYNGMEFKLDWERGTDRLVGVFYRPSPGDVHAEGHHQDGPPQSPIYVGGRQYFTNCFNCNPTGGTGVALVWLLRDGVAVPVAAVGEAARWDRLKADEFKPRLPPGVTIVDAKGRPSDPVMFTWSDLNDDGRMQPDEVTFVKGPVGSVVVMPDLAVITAQAMRLQPQGFTKAGSPIYDLAKAAVLVPDTQRPTSSGGGQAMLGKDDRVIFSTAPKPFAPQSVGGAHKGRAVWSYPSPWPGLHASHAAPLPEVPGQLIGTTRLLGWPVVPRGSDAGEVWAVNGNKGNVYLFTTDGLFVATLFKDCRTTSWSMPAATRGMLLGDTTIHEEDFWPSITQTADGAVHLLVGVHTTCTLVQVDGLDTIRRLPETTLAVTGQQLAAAQQYFVDSAAERVRREGRDTLLVAMRISPPKVDGRLDDWADAAWVTIDQRISKVGDWGSKPDVTSAAVAVAGDRLYVAFRTSDPNLLRNSGESAPMLFKTGGGLDLMIGANPAADPTRRESVGGDLRLLVTMAKGKPVAALYRPVVPGTKDPAAFSSPWRTVKIDRVDDVSKDVELAGDKDGSYEFSVPLATLGLKPRPGLMIRGDVGILRGDGFRTIQRVYWQNKATGMTSDVPSEALLSPLLWGRWQFSAP